jgi:hypothetical protein
MKTTINEKGERNQRGERNDQAHQTVIENHHSGQPVGIKDRDFR